MKKNALKGIACILALAVMMTYSFGFFTVPVQAKKDTGVKSVKITNVKSKKITIGKGKKVKLSIALVLKKGSKQNRCDQGEETGENQDYRESQGKPEKESDHHRCSSQEKYFGEKDFYEEKTHTVYGYQFG